MRIPFVGTLKELARLIFFPRKNSWETEIKGNEIQLFPLVLDVADINTADIDISIKLLPNKNHFWILFVFYLNLGRGSGTRTYYALGDITASTYQFEVGDVGGLTFVSDEKIELMMKLIEVGLTLPLQPYYPMHRVHQVFRQFERTGFSSSR